MDQFLVNYYTSGQKHWLSTCTRGVSIATVSTPIPDKLMRLSSATLQRTVTT